MQTLLKNIDFLEAGHWRSQMISTCHMLKISPCELNYF